MTQDRRRVAPKPIRDEVEQAIARGWSNQRIIDNRPGVTYQQVVGVRAALDKLALEDDDGLPEVLG